MNAELGLTGPQYNMALTVYVWSPCDVALKLTTTLKVLLPLRDLRGAFECRAQTHETKRVDFDLDGNLGHSEC